MNREDLSKPPPDEKLLQDIVRTTLAEFPTGGAVTMRGLRQIVREQCPSSVNDEQIAAEVAEQVKSSDLAIKVERAE